MFRKSCAAHDDHLDDPNAGPFGGYGHPNEAGVLVANIDVRIFFTPDPTLGCGLVPWVEYLGDFGECLAHASPSSCAVYLRNPAA